LYKSEGFIRQESTEDHPRVFGSLLVTFGPSSRLGLEVNRVSREPSAAQGAPVCSRSVQLCTRAVQIEGAVVLMVALPRWCRRANPPGADLRIAVPGSPVAEPRVVQRSLVLGRSVDAGDAKGRMPSDQPLCRRPEPEDEIVDPVQGVSSRPLKIRRTEPVKFARIEALSTLGHTANVPPGLRSTGHFNT